MTKEIKAKALDAGADLVKFQTFSASRLVAKGAPLAAYQATTGESDHYEMIRRLELGRDDHERLVEFCRSNGIGFFSTAFDIESVDLLVELGQTRFKVASGEINNLPLLRHIGSFGREVILSTGMADLTEVAVALRVLHRGGGPVEAHVPGVQRACQEGRRVVALEIRGRVGDEGEGSRVGFREAIEGKGGDLSQGVFLGLGGKAALLHARAQPLFHALHALARALEPHGAPQFFGLAAAKARRRHGDAQQLFLEERYAEGSLQDGFERRMGVDHGLTPRAPVQVGVDHLSHDGSGPDDGDLHHQIVEARGFEARQRGHLRAAFDLKGADGVGLANHRVGVGIVGWQVGEVDLGVFVRADQRDAVFQSFAVHRLQLAASQVD